VQEVRRKSGAECGSSAAGARGRHGGCETERRGRRNLAGVMRPYCSHRVEPNGRLIDEF
jgi:hypothetical protein